MHALRRSSSALLTLAALLGAVALVLTLTRCAPPPAGGVASSPPRAGGESYPLPAPPSPEAEALPTVDPTLAAMADADETAWAAPSPTPTSAPRVAPTPLPPLLPGYATVIYAGRGETGMVLYRVQVDETGQVAAPPVPLPPLGGSWAYDALTHIRGLRASPDGLHVAVDWSHGEMQGPVVIVDAQTGLSRPLGEMPSTFLAWAPDGRSALIQESAPLSDPATMQLVELASGARTEIPVPFSYPEPQPRAVRSASFSPDGEALVISHSRCWGCENEIWRVSLDGQEPTLLHRTETERVAHVVWSPRGDQIAFTQWQPGEEFARLSPAEILVMDAVGGNVTSLGECLASVDPAWETRPEWNAAGNALLAVRTTEGADAVLAAERPQDVHSSGFLLDVETRTVTDLSTPGEASVLGAQWIAPDALVYLARPVDPKVEGYTLWRVAVTDHDSAGAQAFVGWDVTTTPDAIPAAAWLPPSQNVPLADMPPVTPEPAPLPWPIPTYSWTLPTPVRPEGPTPTSWPARALPPHPAGSILFVAREGDTGTLHRLPADGEAHTSTASRLSEGLSPEFFSSVTRIYPSPDGRLLALVSFYEHNFEPHIIHMVEKDTGKSWPIATEFHSAEGIYVEARFGDWHPDGRHFYLYGNDVGGIFLMDALGEEPLRYLSDHHPTDGLAISPDGQRLAFATRPRLDTGSYLCIAWGDGSHAERILSGQRQFDPLTVIGWSPQSDRLLYMRNEDLWLMDRDGTNQRALGVDVGFTYSESMPRWSPDGEMIAFPHRVSFIPKDEPRDGSDLGFRHATTYLVDVQTGEQRKMVPDDHEVGDLYPTWSPDGQWLAFISDRSGTLEIWTVRRDGTGLQQVTSIGTTISPPVWDGVAGEEQP